MRSPESEVWGSESGARIKFLILLIREGPRRTTWSFVDQILKTAKVSLQIIFKNATKLFNATTTGIIAHQTDPPDFGFKISKTESYFDIVLLE